MQSEAGLQRHQQNYEKKMFAYARRLSGFGHFVLLILVINYCFSAV